MKNYKLNLRRNTGFSLLELMGTVGIAATVLVVGVPSFSSSIDNERMTSASCTPGADWNYGWIVFANADDANLGTVDLTCTA